MASKRVIRPMTLMVLSAEAERIHMALMTGATAAAMGKKVTFFFSKGAAKFLTAEGWAGLTNAAGQSGPEMDAVLEAKGVAGTDLLMEGLRALDVRFVVCETALKEYDIDPISLTLSPAVEISGLADVIEKGEGGDWLTF